MTTDIRHQHARAYAESARARKTERECSCSRCIQAAEDEKLQAVLRIVNSYEIPVQKKTVRRVK
jgi:hypothetical protein